VLEDQGQDPVDYFTSFGVPRRQILNDAVRVAASSEPDGPGPRVVTGPIAVRGARPGDMLKIEVLKRALRVPYGVVSNREGKGALPGEYPEEFRGVPAYEKYLNKGNNVSVFTKVAKERGLPRCASRARAGGLRAGAFHGHHGRRSRHRGAGGLGAPDRRGRQH